jgi:hypothetical protein
MSAAETGEAGAAGWTAGGGADGGAAIAAGRRLSRTEIAARAAYMLRGNDRGSLTVAAPRLYPHMWSWDAAFIAIGLAPLSADRALTELETLFAAQWRTGMVPHIVFHADAPAYEPGPQRWGCREVCADAPEHPPTSGLIQPPVHAMAVRRIMNAIATAEAVQRRELLDRIRALWPALLGWHRYLATRRDPDGRGLLTMYHGWETGMDNSPRWDVPYASVVPGSDLPPYRRTDLNAIDGGQRPTAEDYDRYLWLIEEMRRAGYDDAIMRRTLSFRVADVFASAIFAAANEDLADVGRELGLGSTDELRGYADRFRRGVVGLADARGFAADLDLRAGRALRTDTIAGFAPLLSGGLDGERQRRLVALLESPAWCGNERLARAVPPSTSPNAAAFDPARYWRGPQWPPMNWLLIQGLDRRGERAAAARLTEATLDQLADGRFAEYYHPFTQQPLGGRPQSWTTAVALDLLARGE